MFSKPNLNADKPVPLTDSQQLAKELDEIKNNPYYSKELNIRRICATIAGAGDPKPLIEQAIKYCEQNKFHRDYTDCLEKFIYNPQKFIESELKKDFEIITGTIDHMNRGGTGSCEMDDQYMRGIYRDIAHSMKPKTLFNMIYEYVHKPGNGMLMWYMKSIEHLHASEQHFNEVFGEYGYRPRPQPQQQDNAPKQSTFGFGRT